MADPEAQLETLLARFLPEVAAVGRATIARLRACLPGCDVLVYDNYNALAVGFSPTGKTGNAFLSVALYPRWVSLFMSAGLDDPSGLLKGEGTKVRHIVLKSADVLDNPAIAALLAQAIELAIVPSAEKRQSTLVIKSISANQRPRRPG